MEIVRDSTEEFERKIIEVMTYENELSAELDALSKRRRRMLEAYYFNKYLIENRTVRGDDDYDVHVVEFEISSMDLSRRPVVLGRRKMPFGVDKKPRRYANWSSPGEENGGNR